MYAFDELFTKLILSKSYEKNVTLPLKILENKHCTVCVNTVCDLRSAEA